MTYKNIVLAFSGGLDTTYCAVYLKKEFGAQVHAVLVNTGGFSDEEIERIHQHALQIGVASFKAVDAKKEFYQKVIRFLLFGNVLKNNTYPLSVSAERTVQAMCVADYTRSLGAEAIAHGSTGAGNDQVRFDMVFQILAPEVNIIAPVRDKKVSREEEISYLQQHGVKMDFAKAAYSINKGMWGTSVGGKETLTSHLPLPDEAYPQQLINHTPAQVTITFHQGEVTAVNDLNFASAVEAINHLNQLAGAYAIGRDTHVGDTIIGIKGRVGFEAPAALLLIKAHHALEKHVLTKWQLYWKDMLAQWYGNWLHEGQYLDPVMRNMESFIESTQKYVTGKVSVQLFPYRFVVEGVKSEFDLMQSTYGSYGEMNNKWTGDDVKGFTKIFAQQTGIYYHVHQNEQDNG